MFVYVFDVLFVVLICYLQTISLAAYLFISSFVVTYVLLLLKYSALVIKVGYPV